MRARRELQRDRAALAVARAQAVEITGLQRATKDQLAIDLRARLVERVLGERGLKASLTSLEVKESRAYITFAAIGFDALVGMLDALGEGRGLSSGRSHADLARRSGYRARRDHTRALTATANTTMRTCRRRCLRSLCCSWRRS